MKNMKKSFECPVKFNTRNDCCVSVHSLDEFLPHVGSRCPLEIGNLYKVYLSKDRCIYMPIIIICTQTHGIKVNTYLKELMSSP